MRLLQCFTQNFFKNFCKFDYHKIQVVCSYPRRIINDIRDIIFVEEFLMKKLLFGFTLGIVTGAIALKKMEKSNVPEKAVKLAEKKLKDS